VASAMTKTTTPITLSKLPAAVLAWAALCVLALVMFAVPDAFAQVVGAPEPWQLNMQAPATPVKDRIAQFHDLLLILCVAISVFVLVLLLYVMWRFRASANPVPSKTSHNTLIEVVWTLVPCLILVLIAVPSFRLLYFEDRQIDADMTVKVVGSQWYWTYHYPDFGDFSYDSIMIERADIKPGQRALLDVDNRLVVPVGAKVRIQLTANDVLHAFYVPSFGVQRTAVPGKINETWFQVEKPGVYYGQCTELCGIKHAYMPIAIEAMPKDKFDQWVAAAKQKYARLDDTAVKVAAVQQ
jgi:cytochrome c oxidase subunit 2